jgi:hypothetical protein
MPTRWHARSCASHCDPWCLGDGDFEWVSGRALARRMGQEVLDHRYSCWQLEVGAEPEGWRRPVYLSGGPRALGSDMVERLAGKVALVTGAARGQGRAGASDPAVGREARRPLSVSDGRVVGPPRRAAVESRSSSLARIDSNTEAGTPRPAVNQAFEGRDGPVLQPLVSGDCGSTPICTSRSPGGISPNREPLKTEHFATPGWAT